jgi:hypothetical protein
MTVTLIAVKYVMKATHVFQMAFLVTQLTSHVCLCLFSEVYFACGLRAKEFVCSYR